MAGPSASFRRRHWGRSTPLETSTTAHRHRSRQTACRCAGQMRRRQAKQSRAPSSRRCSRCRGCARSQGARRRERRGREAQHPTPCNLRSQTRRGHGGNAIWTTHHLQHSPETRDSQRPRLAVVRPRSQARRRRGPRAPCLAPLPQRLPLGVTRRDELACSPRAPALVLARQRVSGCRRGAEHARVRCRWPRRRRTTPQPFHGKRLQQLPGVPPLSHTRHSST